MKAPYFNQWLWGKFSTSRMDRPLWKSFSWRCSLEVCINGGAGGIGQPLTMLMAMNESVKEAPARSKPGRPCPGRTSCFWNAPGGQIIKETSS